MMDKILYRLESDKPFDTVVSNIEKRVPEHKFRVLAVHDVQQTLREKGIERDPLKIIEVCNASFANEALSKSLNVALFMPCKYTVYPENGKTVVNLGRPSMISRMIPDAGLGELADQVEKQLIRILEESI
jgi:uncharacterized protein (DUF302 family)